MRRKTHISNALEVANGKAEYDAEAKKILSDKQVLAWILKSSVREFKEYSIEQIIASIEGEPEVASVPVYPGKQSVSKERITGLSVEDKVPNEGETTYDIRFFAITQGKEKIKLIINVEAQKDYYPGYDLVTRGVFYGARMLSAQMDTEFTAENYDDIKKVYSIWICMNAPDYAANTITEYHMTQNNLIGKFPEKSRYDLLSVIMICLKKNTYKEEKTSDKSKVHGMLSVLFAKELLPEEKEEILNREYGIVTSVEMEKEMRQMCNLSDLIEKEGIAKGKSIGVQEGQNRMLLLIQKMTAAGEGAFIDRLNEADFLEEMYQKYEI